MDHVRKKLQKIVVIVGPTASGKTSLAIELAKIFDGEVISADSRQVYQGFDIGTDKITRSEMQSVPHHLIDVADPTDTYTAADFMQDADKAIADITARDRLPIIAGGTLFYIDALLGNRMLAEVPANTALRAELEALPTEELYNKFALLDPQYAGQIDRHNARRLIRALEIVTTKGSMPTPARRQRYDACIIGIAVPRNVLRARIDTRLDETLARGLIQETKNLLTHGVPESRLNEIGLEYRVVLAHLRGEYSYEEMCAVLKQKVWQYARRQRTWLRSMDGVRWYGPADTRAIETATRQFLL